MDKCPCNSTTQRDYVALAVMALIGLLTAINEWSIPLRESRAMTIVMGTLLIIVSISSAGLIAVATNPDAAKLVYTSETWQTLSAGYQAFWCSLGRCS